MAALGALWEGLTRGGSGYDHRGRPVKIKDVGLEAAII